MWSCIDQDSQCSMTTAYTLCDLGIVIGAIAPWGEQTRVLETNTVTFRPNGGAFIGAVYRLFTVLHKILAVSRN